MVLAHLHVSVEQKATINARHFLTLLKWFINESGHPAFRDLIVPDNKLPEPIGGREGCIIGAGSANVIGVILQMMSAREGRYVLSMCGRMSMVGWGEPSRPIATPRVTV